MRLWGGKVNFYDPSLKRLMKEWSLLFALTRKYFDSLNDCGMKLSSNQLHDVFEDGITVGRKGRWGREGL